METDKKTMMGQPFPRSLSFKEKHKRLLEIIHSEDTVAILIDADLRGANLHGAVLEGATTGGMHYSSETQWPAGADPEALGAIIADSHEWLGAS